MAVGVFMVRAILALGSSWLMLWYFFETKSLISVLSLAVLILITVYTLEAMRRSKANKGS